jgi:prepilin-type N-terminal cleavage/methylation domain-containing protein
MKNQKGFTLIELLVFVTIIGFVAMIYIMTNTVNKYLDTRAIHQKEVIQQEVKKMVKKECLIKE